MFNLFFMNPAEKQNMISRMNILLFSIHRILDENFMVC